MNVSLPSILKLLYEMNNTGVTGLILPPNTDFEHARNYWASEASPTLGCSIEISRDICMLSVCLSYVKSRGIT